MRRLLFFFFITAVIGFAGKAQDTLYMMSGRMMTGVEVMRMDSQYVYYLREGHTQVNSQGRIKSKVKQRENVFEIRYSNGKRELAYLQDTAGYILNPDQMRSYVDGCHDAFEQSHDRLVGPACFAITMGSFVVIPYPLAVVAVPSAFSGILALLTPKFPEDQVDESKVNKYYIMGYQDTKKIKKVKSAGLFGSAALLIGLTFITLQGH